VLTYAISVVSIGASVNSNVTAADAGADANDNDKILRQVTICIRVYNFGGGAQNAITGFGSVRWFTGTNRQARPGLLSQRQPFVEMKSAKRRETIVAGIVSRIDQHRVSLLGIHSRHRSTERRAPLPDERTLPDNEMSQ